MCIVELDVDEFMYEFNWKLGSCIMLFRETKVQ